MADHFYGLNVGQGIGGVTVGTSTGATSVELRVTDSTTGMSKTELLRLVEVIEYYIDTADAPA